MTILFSILSPYQLFGIVILYSFYFHQSIVLSLIHIKIN